MLSTGTALTRVAPAPGAEPPRRLNATVPDSRPSTATRSTTMPSTSPAPPSTGLPLAPGLTGENSNSSVAEPPPCGPSCH